MDREWLLTSKRTLFIPSIVVATTLAFFGFRLLQARLDPSAYSLAKKSYVDAVQVFRWLEEYRSQRGAFPREDVVGEWRRAVASALSIPDDQFSDAWGNPIRFRLKDSRGSAIAGGEALEVWSTGEDGVDQAGFADDILISARMPLGLSSAVNDGAYWARRRAWSIPLIGSGAVVALGGAMTLGRGRKKVRPRALISFLVQAFCGLALVTAGWTLDSGIWGARQALSACAGPWMFISGMALVVQIPSWLGLQGSLRAIHRALSEPWQCRNCGYDLRGNSYERCPECGTELRPDPSTRPIQSSRATQRRG